MGQKGGEKWTAAVDLQPTIQSPTGSQGKTTITPTDPPFTAATPSSPDCVMVVAADLSSPAGSAAPNGS